MIDKASIPSDKKGAEIHLKAIKVQMLDLLRILSTGGITTDMEISCYAMETVEQIDEILEYPDE